MRTDMGAKNIKHKKSWWKTFTGKQRLSMSDSGDGTEQWYMYISPVRVLIGFLALVLILFFAAGMIIAYTPIMDMIPGYPGAKSREMLVQGIMRLDSLEREMAHLTIYSDNIAMIMEGKTPVIRDVSRIGDSIEIQDKAMVLPSAADSLFRAQLEGSGAYSLSAAAATERARRSSALDLVAPVQGLVQVRFNPIKGQFGVEIRTTANQPVAAVRDGNVILSIWTPEYGHIVQIQHPDNMISVYKGVSQFQNKIGSRVRGGEIIGVAGEIDEQRFDTTRPFGFELWYNGTPVDPEGYIVF